MTQYQGMLGILVLPLSLTPSRSVFTINAVLYITLLMLVTGSHIVCTFQPDVAQLAVKARLEFETKLVGCMHTVILDSYSYEYSFVRL